MRPRWLVLAFALLAASLPASARERVDLRRTRAVAGALEARAKSGWVRLALDPELQRTAAHLLAKARPHEGAIVVSDVATGKILAWVSRGGARDWVATPFAPSASVFKVVTAAALLESGEVSPQTRQCWSGGERTIEAGDLDDDRDGDDRCTTFGDALGHSVNLVFARMALKHLSAPVLRDEAAGLGIGGPIPIDVDVPESPLAIPDDRLGFARAAAGFWNGKLSPISALFLMQTIANRGERIGLRVRDDGERVLLGRAMSVRTADALTRMLEVTTSSGTSAKAFHDEEGMPYLRRVPVAGKTGTLIGGHPTRMYSWFAGFAPSRKPRIAVSVMLANDVRWWTKANVVARELLQKYFETRTPRPT